MQGLAVARLLPLNPASATKANTSRTHLWMESLGDWTWPDWRPVGFAAAAAPWVPAFPRLEPVGVTAGAGSVPWHGRATPRRLLLATLLSALAAVCCALALKGSLTFDGLLARARPPRCAGRDPHLRPRREAAADARAVSQDAAGSSIDRASFTSAALPAKARSSSISAGFASTTQHYPVLYLLHGRNGHANAFLEVGVQRSLDRLIAAARSRR